MPYSKQEQITLSKIGQNIRRERKVKSLSQEALAFEADLDRTYIGSVERGERNIAVLNLVKIAKALKINVQELLTEVDG